MDGGMTVSVLDMAIAFVGLVITIAGIIYAFTRRWFSLASEEYVATEVEDEFEPIEERIDTVVDSMECNEEQIQELHKLIEGGNSKFEKGMMDFLEDNIERTNAIKEDLEDIRDTVHELNEEN
jgi:chaperonin cofactor prefoldin